MQNADVMRYELPPEGITLLGYVVRRMHKTALLSAVPALLREAKTVEALETVARYAVASSTSFGRAFYQPRFNRVGEFIEERDPQTGALVRAELVSASPHYHITYAAKMQNGDVFEGEERITGTTVGLRGLGMPAPSKFRFASGVYAAEMTGLLTSELAFSLWGGTKIRAYGFLNAQDNFGNAANLSIDRRQKIDVKITRP
ncbi:MAG: hypothetical protein Fur002_02570 [Anaerolineales bacterium]